jgi:hypothetical protein
VSTLPSEWSEPNYKGIKIADRLKGIAAELAKACKMTRYEESAIGAMSNASSLIVTCASSANRVEMATIRP